MAAGSLEARLRDLPNVSSTANPMLSMHPVEGQRETRAIRSGAVVLSQFTPSREGSPLPSRGRSGPHVAFADGTASPAAGASRGHPVGAAGRAGGSAGGGHGGGGLGMGSAAMALEEGASEEDLASMRRREEEDDVVKKYLRLMKSREVRPRTRTAGARAPRRPGPRAPTARDRRWSRSP